MRLAVEVDGRDPHRDLVHEVRHDDRQRVEHHGHLAQLDPEDVDGADAVCEEKPSDDRQDDEQEQSTSGSGLGLSPVDAQVVEVRSAHLGGMVLEACQNPPAHEALTAQAVSVASRGAAHQGRGQVWTGSLPSMCTEYSSSIRRSASRRSSPCASKVATARVDHSAPLTPLVHRPSITPR